MNDTAKTFESRGEKLGFAALNCFFIGTTAAWLGYHRSPPHWDDSWYLTNSLLMFDALAEGGLLGYARKFLSILGTKPPLLTVLPTPLYLMLGRHFRYAYLVNIFFMPVLFLALYRIAKGIWNGRTGLMAIYILGTMPLLYGLSRWYLVEYALSGLACVALSLLINSQDFRNTRTAFWFGMTCGFGLLLKISFPLYVIFPFFFVLTKFLLRSEARPGSVGPVESLKLRPLLAFALPAVLLPLPWYVSNGRRAIEHGLRSGFSEQASFYGTGDVFSLRAIETYLMRLVNTGPSCYYVFLAAFLVGILAVTGKTGAFIKLLSRKALVIFSLWTLPFFIFLFGRNKDVRFVAPLLPAFALMLAFTLDFALNWLGRWRHALMCVILAFPLVGLLQASFGILGNRRATLGSFQLMAPDLGYAEVYDKHVWPHQEILEILTKSARFKVREKMGVMVGNDAEAFNVNNFELAAAEERLPLKVETTAYESDLNKLLSALNSASFFVYKERGKKDASFTNKYFKEAVREVRENARFVEVPHDVTLPDGGVLHIFKNLSPAPDLLSRAFIPDGLDRLEDCEVDFDHKIRLTGLAVRQTASFLDVKYRWRCMKPLDGEFWCFTHLIDERDDVLGYLDHQILGGEPPTTSWKAGDVAVEQLRFKLASSQAAKTFRLRLGLFRKLSGERLAIVGSPHIGRTRLALTTNNTAVLVEGGGTAPGDSRP